MDSIFLSIACYKDTDLVKTVWDAYNKAASPERIVFGVYFQGESSDLNFFLKKLPRAKFTIRFVEVKDTKGTGWARNILTRDMLTDEDFWLQIDSHTRFANHWDFHLINMYKMDAPFHGIKESDFLISGYPPHFGMNEEYDVYSTRDLVNKAIVKDFTEMYSFRDTIGKIPNEYFEESITASGAFQFTTNKVAKSMTFDEYFNPWMDQEISSCLAYMNGYNIYCPRKAFLWHCYENNHKGSHEKWRPLVAEEHNVVGYNMHPFDVIKTWKTKRTWQEWHDRVVQDINLSKTLL